MARLLYTIPVLTALCGACAEPTIGSRTDELSQSNGTWLNGTWLNGTWLNGTWLNGTWLNGTWLNGTSLNGATVTDVHLDGSQLVGTQNGRTVAGDDFRNAQLTGVDGSGNAVTLKVDAVGAPPEGSDVWTYSLSYKANGWYALCPDSAVAVAVSGRWDEHGAKIEDANVVTFACRGRGAIAKCVDMGYRPWAQVDDTALEQHHAACVRMVRADVCGDGTSYTVDGNLINVYDALGIQVPDTAQSWTMEAEWTPAGARCVNAGGTARLLSSGATPPCLAALETDTCGAPGDFSTGTLVMTDIPAN